MTLDPCVGSERRQTTQLETQPTPSLLGTGRSPAWGRVSGSRWSPGCTQTGLPAWMQPVVVEACHVATKTTSRKTLETLEMFWVGFKRKRWKGLQESVGRGDQAQDGRHGPSVGLLVEAWLW